MLQIIGTQKEIKNLQGLVPEFLMERIRELATILDENYGKDRNIFDDDGGYICIAENDSDIAELKEKHDFDLTPAITQYCDQIPEHWLEMLTLYHNDFGMVVFVSSNTTVYQKLLNEYHQKEKQYSFYVTSITTNVITHPLYDPIPSFSQKYIKFLVIISDYNCHQ